MERFEVFYERERSRVLAACVALSGDLDSARDATDEAFARALRQWLDVAVMSSPGGWVQTVALNQQRRTLRRQRFERRIVRDRSFNRVEAPVPPDPALWAAVRALPARQQTAIVLRYVHDLPENEIALAMGVARGTVASTLAAARSKLGAQLVDGRDIEDGAREFADKGGDIEERMT